MKLWDKNRITISTNAGKPQELKMELCEVKGFLYRTGNCHQNEKTVRRVGEKFVLSSHGTEICIMHVVV